jgi:hypothetical protein
MRHLCVSGDLKVGSITLFLFMSVLDILQLPFRYVLRCKTIFQWRFILQVHLCPYNLEKISDIPPEVTEIALSTLIFR